MGMAMPGTSCGAHAPNLDPCAYAAGVLLMELSLQPLIWNFKGWCKQTTNSSIPKMGLITELKMLVWTSSQHGLFEASPKPWTWDTQTGIEAAGPSFSCSKGQRLPYFFFNLESRNCSGRPHTQGVLYEPCVDKKCDDWWGSLPCPQETSFVFLSKYHRYIGKDVGVTSFVSKKAETLILGAEFENQEKVSMGLGKRSLYIRVLAV